MWHLKVRITQNKIVDINIFYLQQKTVRWWTVMGDLPREPAALFLPLRGRYRLRCDEEQRVWSVQRFWLRHVC